MEDQIQQQAQQVMESMPLWVNIGTGMIAFWGLMMWLFGRKLVKPSFTVTGLAIGAVAGALIFREKNPDLASRWMYWAAGGGLLGAVAFYLLLRLWMAVTLAAICGLIAPLAFAAFQGNADANLQNLNQTLGKAAGDTLQDAVDTISKNTGQTGLDPQTGQRLETDRDKDDGPSQLGIQVNDAMNRFADALSQWWKGMAGSDRWTMCILALIGAAIGLVVGLVMKNTTAMLVTSSVGASLMLLSANHLVGEYAPKVAQYLPDTAGKVLMTLGIATIIGTVFQWMFTRDSADNG